MIRTLTNVALLAAAPALLLASGAQAQDAGQNAGKWSFTLGAATDNRSKDASKSDGDPYVYGVAEWESASGLFYGSGGLETIDGGGSKLESELVVGVRPELAGFDFDLNVAHKYRFDANPGYDDDAWEFTADMKRSIGPASARLRLQHSPDGTGSTKAWTWVALRGGWDFTDKLNVSAEIGRRDQDNSVDYTGWNIGASYALTRNLEAQLRWHDTDADVPGEQYKGALVAGISVSF
ncbi:TorF family putative porin [Brevundimonas faecalis]|uniref:TorF family putative porin n=1 Tax=Brevundimonas faecalis TaxID=947378 RepID=UPI00360999A5